MSNITNLAPKLENIETLASNLRHLMQSNMISECELARQTDIPQPTIHKILTGKTTDPRASTLKSIADFFEISIEELLTGNPSTHNNSKTQAIAIISWADCLNADNFIKNLTPSNWNNWVVTEFLSKNAYGLISKPCMEPRFPRKTILIIDPDLTPEDGDIVLVHYANTQEATLREMTIDGPSKLLVRISDHSEQAALDDSTKILGVLVKSTISYHS